MAILQKVLRTFNVFTSRNQAYRKQKIVLISFIISLFIYHGFFKGNDGGHIKNEEVKQFDMKQLANMEEYNGAMHEDDDSKHGFTTRALTEAQYSTLNTIKLTTDDVVSTNAPRKETTEQEITAFTSDGVNQEMTSRQADTQQEEYNENAQQQSDVKNVYYQNHEKINENFVEESNNLSDDERIEHEKIQSDNKENYNNLKSCEHQPSTLVGRTNVNQNITPSYEEVKQRTSENIFDGGCFAPKHCRPLQKVAVIIPFKDRDEHLRTLLYYLHPMLERQQIHYCIYVVEQFDSGTFNKAMVMNAGYEEVMKLDSYDCIIFHDVDMIPEDDRNMYLCDDKSPKHLSPAIDKFDYLLHYGTEFGGVTATGSEMYRKLNGHSNQFWGWGGEDNDMEYRIKYHNLTIIKSNAEYGRYKMIPHHHSWKFSESTLPMRLNATTIERATTDGLNSLNYKMKSIERHSLYTKIFVDIRTIEILKLQLKINGIVAKDFELQPGPCRWETFKDKYLDLVIDLSTVKEIYNYTIWPDKDVLEPGEPRTFGELAAEVNQDGKPKRFAMVHSKTQALELCNKLTHCRGVLREGNNEYYTLRKMGKPRHLPPPTLPKITMLGDHDLMIAELMKHPMKDRMAYTKYCPGESSDIAKVERPLKMEVIDEHKPPANNYEYYIQFRVLQPIDNYFYYRDQKEFEGQYKREKNRFVFSFPHGAPNITDDFHPIYDFDSPTFPIQNVAGTFTVASVLEDHIGQPLFKWNWWYEVSTGDFNEDILLRDSFYRRMVNSNVAWRKNRKDPKSLEEHKEEYHKNVDEFNRKMEELKKRSLRNALRMNQVISDEEKKRIEDMVMGVEQKDEPK